MKFLTNLDLQKNELQNATLQNLATDPASPVQGQVYYNTASDAIKVYDGAAWITLATGGGTVTSVTGSGAISSSGGNTPNITIADGSTSVKGAVQLEDSYASTSTTKAATPAAVKAAYDLAATKVTSGGALGTPSSGTLTNVTGLPIGTGVSGLGTGVATFLATPSSANLASAVTDETGSGALVFANSPVLNGAEITNTGGTPRIHGVYLPDGHNITFEGATTDEFETVVTVADPTADRTITLPNATGTVALTANKLSAFAATTSAELAGVISDETGTGALVFANTPTLVTPNIGAATGTSLVLSGDLTVNGTTTTINSTTLTVDDKNIELGSVATPSDATADGGGITLKGTTDKTINWVDATDAWTLSEHADLASGKVYKINNTEVLSGTTLGSGVTGSSLTSVGTITTGTWNATDIAVAAGGTGASDAGTARTNLGLAIGSDVQAYNATLAAVAGGTYAGDDSITTVGTIAAGTWQGTAIASTYGGALRYNTSAAWTAGEAKTVTHSLGTKAVVVSVYDSGDAQVFCDVVTATTNTLTVTISLAGTYRVVVLG